MAIGKPLNEFINKNKTQLNNDNIHQAICNEIDKEIHKNYHLYAYNYAAYDIYHMSQKYLGTKYSENDLEALTNYIDNKVASIKDINKQDLKNGIIKLYAMPLINALKTKIE